MPDAIGFNCCKRVMGFTLGFCYIEARWIEPIFAEVVSRLSFGSIDRHTGALPRLIVAVPARLSPTDHTPVWSSTGLTFSPLRARPLGRRLALALASAVRLIHRITQTTIAGDNVTTPPHPNSHGLSHRRPTRVGWARLPVSPTRLVRPLTRARFEATVAVLCHYPSFLSSLPSDFLPIHSLRVSVAYLTEFRHPKKPTILGPTLLPGHIRRNSAGRLGNPASTSLVPASSESLSLHRSPAESAGASQWCPLKRNSYRNP